MKKRNQFSYYKNIVLTVSGMDELHRLILRFCDDVSFDAKTKNNASISFDSYDELINYSNYKQERIAHLTITGHNRETYSERITIDFLPIYSSPSVSCTYCFSSADKETIFVKDFVSILDKLSRIDFANKVGLWTGLFLLLFAGVYTVLRLSPLLTPPGIFAISFLSLVFATGIYFVFVYCIWRKLFPKVMYAWGEEEIRANKLDALRSNLLWGVVVATIVSLVVGLFTGN